MARLLTLIRYMQAKGNRKEVEKEPSIKAPESPHPINLMWVLISTNFSVNTLCRLLEKRDL